MKSPLSAFAAQCGYHGPAFSLDLETRELLLRELDAIFFITARVSREDVEYIMDGFKVRRESDVVKYGHFRTKGLVLEFYDAIKGAIESGSGYRSRLEVSPI